MGIILFIVFAFVVGLLARALLPGRQAMSFLGTTALGIAGSFVGGFVASLLTHQPVGELHTAGILRSIVGAILLLVLVGVRSARRAVI